MIRAMTSNEIRAALRHGAQVCIERSTALWAGLTVLSQDGAFFAADEWSGDDGDTGSPEHAAHFLLLVAEAVE